MKLRVLIILFLSAFGVMSSHSQTANPVGDALSLGGDCFRITSESQNQSGAVWYSEQLDLTSYFALTLEVNLGDQDEFGADGIVFVMQQVGLDAIGVNGNGLGFEGFSPSFGVELDTFENGNTGDIPEDHMAMFRDGEVNHFGFTSIAPPIPIMPDGSNVENGEPIIFKMVWDPLLQEVQMYIDCELRMTGTVDLVNDIFQGDSFVYWGFTGSTGFYDNEQTVCFLEAEYLHPTLELEMCLGDDLELDLATSSAENIVWSPNEFIDDVNSANPIVSPESNTIYTVQYTKCGEAFVDTVEVSVTVLDISDIESQELCAGEQATFIVDYDPSYDVLWSNSDADDSANYSLEGTHWAEVTDGTCTRRKFFDLDLIPLPEILVPNSVAYCFEDSTLVELSSVNAQTFLPNGESGNQFYVSTEGDYEVMAIDDGTGCQATELISVSELPLPEISLLSEYEICPYETLDLTINNSYNVEWNDASISNSEQFSQAGSYSVEAELNGCYSSHDFTLEVNPLPVSSVPGSYNYCENTELMLSSDNPNYDFQWPNGQIQDSYGFSEEGVYSVVISNQATGCQIIDQVQTTMVLNPVLEIDPFYELCEGDKITIEPIIENAESIEWSTGSAELEYEFTQAEFFTVSVSNECLELEEESEIVSIICDCEAFVPLAFTPDQDGLNETFLPVLRCDPFEYELTIFDRFGKVVFQTFDPKEAWVGNVNSGEYFVPSDMYNYKLSYKSEQFDGIHVQIKYGTVSVIR